MHKQKKAAKGSTSGADLDLKSEEMDIRKIIKDIEFLGTSNMTWKERKELENRKVVSLGGKPPKKQRLPLSVARVQMKKQKEREDKLTREGMIMRRFGGKANSSSGGREERLKPEDRVLKTSEGRFRNGVLDVKHLLKPNRPESEGQASLPNKGKNKNLKGKKNRGKKGGGRKRR